MKKILQIMLLGSRWLIGLFLLFCMFFCFNSQGAFKIPVILLFVCALIPPINNLIKQKLNIEIYKYLFTFFLFVYGIESLILNKELYIAIYTIILGIFFIPHFFSKFISIFKIKNKFAIFFIGLITYLTFSSIFSSIGMAFNLMPNREVQEIKSLIKYHKTAKAIKMIQTGSPKVTEWLTQNASTIEPPYLYLLADKTFDTNKDAAVFWYMAGRLRGYYDGFKCEDTTARSGLSMLPMFAPKTAQYIHDNANNENLYGIGIKVLEWDEKNPSTNSPLWICSHGIQAFSRPVKYIPENKWESVHQEMRNSFKTSLDKILERNKQDKK